MADKEEETNDENLGQEVDELLEQGMDQKEIEKQGYSPSLIRQRVRKKKKSGKSSLSASKGDSLALRKEKESVLPEWLESDVAEIFDGQIRDRKIFMAGMSVPLMGLRLFAEGVKPMIDLMSVWQKGQAEAAQAAQQSGIEVANAAGEAAAGGVAKFLMETKPWQTTSSDPMKSMMADTMGPMFQQLVGQLMGGLMRPAINGQVNNQPPSANSQGQVNQSGFQIKGDIQQASDDEIEEAFND
jgi:hypothetical protein